MKSEYDKLIIGERLGAHTIEIVENVTGKRGVANSMDKGDVALFYGNDDGSDDTIVSGRDFDARFKVTNIIFG